jgi:hypothetical protein
MANNLILKEISLFIIYSLIASSVLLPANLSHAESRSAVGISHTNKVVILTFVFVVSTMDKMLSNDDNKEDDEFHL